MRIGLGYDVHPLVEGRKLILGGVEIPFEKGLKGHSDADVLLHAIGDAMLGALALGDLGKHFPDTDAKYKGVSSSKLLEEIMKMLSEKAYEVGNVDSILVIERPKMMPHIPQMIQNISRILQVKEDQVSVKATREEGLGFTGKGEESLLKRLYYSKRNKMALKVYNTLTRKKENFVPLDPQGKKVKMYVCGVTVYDYSHVGHARANIVFDMIGRYLKFKGYDLNFVRNFTDVDDKIIKRAKDLTISCDELTQKFIDAFHSDMKFLGNIEVSLEPKATEHIPEMIKMIEVLISKGNAYSKNGDVFYRVRNFKEYGKLSGKNIEDLESGARVEVNEAKMDPLDFALWKSSKPGEPSWDSPWGKGRPGWHIECSAMSMKYLGESFDIHGGGRDLIFPHHENEIAQSEGATGKHFVKYWLHNGFVNINTEKMSKSLGNFFTVQEVLKKFDWEVVRAFLLSVHYRSPIDFSDQNLQDSFQALERFYLTVKRAEDFIKGNQEAKSQKTKVREIDSLLEDFEKAMDDDFNTAKVLGSLFEVVRVVNKSLDSKDLSAASLCDSFLKSLTQIYSVLGCYGTDAEGFFTRNQQKTISETGIDEVHILALIAERREARKNKNFKRSDEIRDELLAKNIVLKDKLDGTTEWSVKS